MEPGEITKYRFSKLPGHMKRSISDVVVSKPIEDYEKLAKLAAKAGKYSLLLKEIEKYWLKQAKAMRSLFRDE